MKLANCSSLSAKFLFILCILQGLAWSVYAQIKPKDAELVDRLKTQFGDKTSVVCLYSSTIITFEYSAGGKAKNALLATMEKKEKLISLRDNLKLTIGLECNDDINVADVKAFDKDNKPLNTEVYDESNEEGEDFFSDERIRAFITYFETKGTRKSYDALTQVTDLRYLPQMYFVDQYPIVTDSIVYKVPKWLNIEFKDVNFNGCDIKKTVRHDSLSQCTIYTFVARSIKAEVSNKNDVPGNCYMYPNILPMCKSYVASNGVNTNIISSVDDLYKFYESLVKEAGNDDTPLKPLVNELIKGKKTDIDKVKAIYYWVEDNIRYVAFENGIMGFKPTPCQTVLNNKYGDCKCMANLLVEMLKQAGFDARHTWLGTKGIVYDLSTPSLAVHNHAICTLVLNGRHYYLDATAVYGSLGYDNDMIQGREVLMENGNTYQIEHIPVAPIESNETKITKTLALSNDLLTGDAHYTYNGDAKTSILYEYNHLPGTEKDTVTKHFIAHNDPNINLLSSTTSNLTDRDIPISINYTFTMKNQVNQFDNDTYVSIDNDKGVDKLILDTVRYHDYEFEYRIYYNVTDTLHIPPGYTIKHVPDNLNVGSNKYSFKITVIKQDDKIIYHKEIKVLDEIIPKKDFKAWNASVKQLKDICDDQFIFTKS